MTMDVPTEPAAWPAGDLNESTDRAWVVVGTAADIIERRKMVIEIDGRQILVLAHDGAFFAFDNICVHRKRVLSKGVILNDKIVCPASMGLRTRHRLGSGHWKRPNSNRSRGSWPLRKSRGKGQ